MYGKWFALTGILAAAMLPAAMMAQPEGAATGTPAFKLLKDLRGQAAVASANASELEGMERSSKITWESHASVLYDLKNEVNHMGQDLVKLVAMRNAATPEERVEIDRVTPLLQALAANMNSAISYVSNDRERLWVPSYQKTVDNIFDEASQISRSTGEFVQLAKTRDHEKRLEKTLDLPVSGS